ncbi:MAG: chemotaxis protein CheR [Bacteroidetes bacterium]|nr:MAG: chemotaxis protein CheR [Bacteroidota bacterium]
MDDNKEYISNSNFVQDFGNFTDRDFHKLSHFIFHEFGIQLPDKKKFLLKSRLVKRLKILGISKYSEYVNYVMEGGTKGSEEVIEMIDVVSTNKTDFFRENAHFDFLIDKVVPDFMGKGIKSPKVWSAGCSSGEEVYTICMVFEEECRLNRLRDYQVYGSDISVSILKKAVKAIYPFSRAEQIPDRYRKRYLLKSKGDGKQEVRILKTLRDKTHFIWLNLMDDQYILAKNFDIIFCRNTLIYFDRETQKQVVSKLLEHLKPGGYLFIGHSESLLNHNIPNLQQIKPTIYLKIK